MFKFVFIHTAGSYIGETEVTAVNHLHSMSISYIMCIISMNFLNWSFSWLVFRLHDYSVDHCTKWMSIRYVNFSIEYNLIAFLQI